MYFHNLRRPEEISISYGQTLRVVIRSDLDRRVVAKWALVRSER